MAVDSEADYLPKLRMLRIFLDANALFSAARASGAMRQILKALKNHGHVLLTAMALRCDALVTGNKTHFGAGCGKSFGVAGKNELKQAN